MKTLLLPGFKILNRLSLGVSFILLGTLFVAPVVFSQMSAMERMSPLEIWAPLGAGLYLLVCLYLWTRIGALRQAETLEKLAGGDLTGRVTAGRAAGAKNLFFTNSGSRRDISAIVRRHTGAEKRENGQIVPRRAARADRLSYPSSTKQSSVFSGCKCC